MEFQKKDYLEILASIASDESKAPNARVRAAEVAMKFMVADTTEDRENRDPSEVILHSIVHSHLVNKDYVVISELLEDAGLLTDKRTANKVGKLLRSLGWISKQKKRDGLPVWHYFRPE